MAVLAVATAGAAIGSFFGAPQVGWLIGAYIGGRLFGEQQQNAEGPRLGDLQVQASTYGSGIPQIFGAMRLAGNEAAMQVLKKKGLIGPGTDRATVSSYHSEIFWLVGECRDC